jgi:hypothetical protein
MKSRSMKKYYLLYDNKNQNKLLTTASDEEKLKMETEYYSTGVWFSYDMKDGSNLLENEKEVKRIKFPEVPKVRVRYGEEEKKITFKWVS